MFLILDVFVVHFLFVAVVVVVVESEFLFCCLH